MQFLTNLNLSQNELQNAVLQPLASAPSTGKLGQVYYNSTDNLLYIYDGSAWRAAGSVVSVAGKTGVVTLVKGDVGLGNVDNTSDATKKANFTGAVADGNTGFVTGDMVFDAIADLGKVLNFRGTVAATSSLPLSGMKKGDMYIVTADNSEYVWTSDSATGTISNYEKLGSTVDLSGYLALSGGTMTGAIEMGSNKITGLADGTASTDAVNRGQLVSVLRQAYGEIDTNSTTCTVQVPGRFMGTYVYLTGTTPARVFVDEEIVQVQGSLSVKFTVAQPPTALLICYVFYSLNA